MKCMTTLCALMFSLAGLSSAAAQDVLTTPDGVRYTSGGIGQSERAWLHSQRNQYALWVTTVARGSGAYLSDAQLTIVDVANQHEVVATPMAGPWFFAALPPGRYRVTAELKLDRGIAQSRSKEVTIAPSSHRQVVFRFDSDAQVSPQRDRPFGGNPFSSEPVRP